MTLTNSAGQRFYLGDEICIPLPWSWLDRRGKLARLLRVIHCPTFARLVERKRRGVYTVVSIDEESSTITIDAAPLHAPNGSTVQA